VVPPFFEGEGLFTRQGLTHSVRSNRRVPESKLDGAPAGLIDDETYGALLLKCLPHIENPTDEAIGEIAHHICPMIRDMLSNFGDINGTISLDQMNAVLVSRGTDPEEAARIATAARTSMQGQFSFSEFAQVFMVDGNALTLAVIRLGRHLASLRQNTSLIDDGTYKAMLLCRIPDPMKAAESVITRLAFDIRNVLEKFVALDANCDGTVSLEDVVAFLVKNCNLDTTRAWSITYAAASNGKLSVSEFVRAVMVHAHLASGAGPERTQVAALTADKEKLTTRVAELKGELHAQAAALEEDKKRMTAENEGLRKDYERLEKDSAAQLKELKDEVIKRVVERDNATKAQQQLQQDLQRAKFDLEMAKTNAANNLMNFQTALAEKIDLEAEVEDLRSRLNDKDANATIPPGSEQGDIEEEDDEKEAQV
jgi:hypothetical protein